MYPNASIKKRRLGELPMTKFGFEVRDSNLRQAKQDREGKDSKRCGETVRELSPQFSQGRRMMRITELLPVSSSQVTQRGENRRAREAVGDSLRLILAAETMATATENKTAPCWIRLISADRLDSSPSRGGDQHLGDSFVPVRFLYLMSANPH